MSEGEISPAFAGKPLKAADQKHCYSCSLIIHASALTCPSCGAVQSAIPGMQGGLPAVLQEEAKGGSLPPNHVYCRGCGKAIHAQAATCPKCGAPQYAGARLQSATGGKDRVTAALLAFFLGGIGGHKFYLGQIGLGLLYLFFCWTFIPMIVALIEGIVYLTMSDADFSQKYP